MDYLIHFTKYKNLLKIIETGGIKFSKMSDTNDPYEKSDLISSVLCKRSKGENYFYDKDFIVKKCIKDEYKIICFSKEDDNKDLEEIVNRPSMWFQYAQSTVCNEKYNGCAFILHKEKFEDEIKDVVKDFRQNDISYNLDKNKLRQLEKEIDDFAIQNKVDEIAKIYEDENLLFLKHSDWLSEKEYRYIYKSSEDIIIPINNSLEAIVMGDYDKKIKQFQKVCSKYNFNLYNRIYRIKWDKGFPKLEKHEHIMERAKLYKELFPNELVKKAL